MTQLDDVATPESDRKRRDWASWIPAIIAITSLAGGVAIGYALHDQIVEPEIVAKEVPQRELNALKEREGLLDIREDSIKKREADLDKRAAAISEQEQTIAANTVSDGVWMVGTDIEPGTYRAQNVSADCYWAITTTGSNGSDIINNGIPGGGNPTVTLAEGQDFESAQCGEWHKQ